MTTQCYGTDGAAQKAGGYKPCNVTAVESGGHTSCCAESDRCMTNGLCQEVGGDKKGSNLFWRNGCTDPTWSDPACPQYCIGNNRPETQAVHYCLSGSEWCCLPKEGAKDIGITTNTTCCAISNLQFTAPSPVVYTIARNEIVAPETVVSSLGLSTIGASSTANTVTTASSSNISNATQFPAAASASTSPTSSSSSASSSRSKLGIYVGVPLGAVLLIALAIVGWLILRKRKNARSIQIPPGSPVSAVETKYPHYVEADVGTCPSELHGIFSSSCQIAGLDEITILFGEQAHGWMLICLHRSGRRVYFRDSGIHHITGNASELHAALLVQG